MDVFRQTAAGWCQCCCSSWCCQWWLVTSVLSVTNAAVYRLMAVRSVIVVTWHRHPYTQRTPNTLSVERKNTLFTFSPEIFCVISHSKNYIQRYRFCENFFPQYYTCTLHVVCLFVCLYVCILKIVFFFSYVMILIDCHKWPACFSGSLPYIMLSVLCYYWLTRRINFSLSLSSTVQCSPNYSDIVWRWHSARGLYISCEVDDLTRCVISLLDLVGLLAVTVCWSFVHDVCIMHMQVIYANDSLNKRTLSSVLWFLAFNHDGVNLTLWRSLLPCG